MTDDFGRPERRKCCPTCRAIGYVVETYCLAKDDDQEVPQSYKGSVVRSFVIGSVIGSREIFETCREARSLADSLNKGGCSSSAESMWSYRPQLVGYEGHGELDVLGGCRVRRPRDPRR